jgi:hypothetical protein
VITHIDNFRCYADIGFLAYTQDIPMTKRPDIAQEGTLWIGKDRIVWIFHNKRWHKMTDYIKRREVMWKLDIKP